MTVTLDRARTPRGLRLYAIGDVHGEADALAAVLDRVHDDIRRRPPPDWRIVLLGDYIDRGPDSRAVLSILASLEARDRTYCLRGNHEQCLIDVLTDPESPSLYPWLMDGGLATLASYGIDATLDDIDDALARWVLSRALATAITKREAGALASMPHAIRFGDFFFAHAGIRPTIALAEQRPRDLMFIRTPFLREHDAHEAVIVHGHGARAEMDVQSNRIGLATLAPGDEACLVLEDAWFSVLSADGLRPLSDSVEDVADAA